ncbi:hypothetical protein SVAN01_04181 [Stagonosporopsis vannaccii]|nr:hypothetical protein SVAN01_04181 [Stagonosporopsis vannaccii]
MASKQRLSFQELFLRLPRELRDLIYADIFCDLAPIPLEDVQNSLAAFPLLAPEEMIRNTTYEAMEALYSHATIRISVAEPQPGEVTCSLGHSTFPQYEKLIRKLVVHAEEALLSGAASLDHLEIDRRGRWQGTRARWEALLQLPRLEKLTVYLQKEQNDRFCWADFTPVLLQLREHLPKLHMSFSVSFDTLLARYWSDPIWENHTEPGNVDELPYDPMGFVDVTELVQLPTQEDFEYVHEHLSNHEETRGQDIVRGLLDETAPQRRALAVHYVVKEPALLRVRMLEHYEVYKKMRTWG